MFEFYEDNKSISYPFEDKPDDGLHEAFVDAYVCYTKSTNPGRVKLTYFDPDTSPQRCELRFEDGTVLCNLIDGVGGVSFSSFICGEYSVYRWIKTDSLSTWFSGEEVVVQFVVKSAFDSYPLSPSSSYLISSLVNRKPLVVRKLAVKLPGLACCSTNHFADGCVVLEPGSNVITAENRSAPQLGLGLTTLNPVRPKKSILLEAVPGAGTGLSFGCPDGGTPSIKSISNRFPDDRGNFSLVGEACTWVERELATDGFSPVNPHTDYTATPKEGSLTLHDDCKACCDCADYGLAYEAIAELWERAKIIADQIRELKSRYLALREQWLNSEACNKKKIEIKLALFARADFHLAVAAIVVNRSGVDIQNAQLDFTITSLNGDGTFEIGSGLLTLPEQAPLQLDGENIIIQELSDGAQVSYSFEKRWDSSLGKATASRTNLGVHVTATITTSEGTDTDSAAATLKSPLTKS